MPGNADRELLAWLNQATLLLSQWEEQAGRQFTALSQGNLGETIAANAQQAQLAEALGRLQEQWCRLSARPFTAAPAAGEEAAHRDEIVAQRRAFQAAAGRAFAVNDRNLKALNLLDLLGATLAPVVSGDPGHAYDRKGLAGSSQVARPQQIDRQG